MAPFEQSVLLRDALAAVGANVELEAVDGADHFFGGADDPTVRTLFQHLIDFHKSVAGRRTRDRQSRYGDDPREPNTT